MSIGGEIIEEMYDKRISEFLEVLNRTRVITLENASLLANIIEKYKEHFKNFGIYGTS